MTRAAAAHASDTRNLSFSGHTSLIAGPAYSRLLSAEPILRKSVPVLMFVFLLTLGVGRATQLTNHYFDALSAAEDEISLIATALSATLSGTDDTTPATVQSKLAENLPPRSTGNMRHIFVTDGDNAIIASAPLRATMDGKKTLAAINRSQPLSVLGARAGVLAVTLDNEITALAT
ncbi:MAG: PAS domain-containing sensor histidine kinase, partial [Hyphomicrobiales bacterium]|nr:PAS domain-containing sensor histidine kinase [Hyphomicrobiales bacterium]